MELKGEQFFAESGARVIEQERPVYRTERGFVLPPGIIPWSEYQRTQTRPMWHADQALQRRIRGIQGTRERFVISEDPEDVTAFERVRAEFRTETGVVVQGVRSILRESGVGAVINGPSEKGLLAWQRNLPRFLVKCFPMLLTSDLAKKEGERMGSFPRVSACFMHFDMDRRLQYLRWHTNVDSDVLERCKIVGFGINADRERMDEAYRRKDFSTIATIVAGHISQAILRFP